MSIFSYKTKQDYKPLKMSQYVLNKHTNLSIKNQNVFCPKRSLKKMHNNNTNNKLNDDDNNNHKQSSMTRNTNNNVNSLLSNNKIHSNTVYEYDNKKNRHISLDSKSKKDIHNNNNNNNQSSTLYKKINEFIYSPLKGMNNVLNGKKNSMSKNKRAMEYSLKVKKINMNNSALAGGKSHSKNKEQNTKKRNTSNDKSNHKMNNKNMYINNEVGDAFINHGLSLLNVQKNNKKSRNINQENASLGSCSTDRSKNNNNYKHGLTMNYMKKTFSNGYTVKTYRDKDFNNELTKYKKVNNTYRHSNNNTGNKSGTINNKKTNNSNVNYNKEKINYTQMYLKKYLFKEPVIENVKNNSSSNKLK